MVKELMVSGWPEKKSHCPLPLSRIAMFDTL
jgi:hypothetical protein